MTRTDSVCVLLYKLLFLTYKALTTAHQLICTAWSLFNPLVVLAPHLLSPSIDPFTNRSVFQVWCN